MICNSVSVQPYNIGDCRKTFAIEICLDVSFGITDSNDVHHCVDAESGKADP